MGFFDKLKSGVESTAKSVAGAAANNPDGLAFATHEKIVFSSLPTTLEEFKAMDGTDFKDPYKVVALTVVALCMYPADKNLSIEMLNFLKGPTSLSAYEMQFLSERFSGKEYLAASYFEGATPNNNYEPSEPYTIKVHKTSHTEDLIGEGYMQFFLKSGGADNARGVKVRKKDSTGEWFLWEYHLLPEIRKPVAADPWA